MIRFLSIAAALIVTVIVLWLPATHPPEHFVERLRHEQAINVDFWGHDPAQRILARMLDLQESLAEARASGSASAALSTAVETAVAGEVSRVVNRIMDNQYFRSIDALVALASYRLAVEIEWFIVLAVFIVALLIDGFISRAVRSRVFVQHSPELFGLCLIVAIGVICATLIALVVPTTIHPLVWCGSILVIGLAARGAVANYHRRA